MATFADFAANLKAAFTSLIEHNYSDFLSEAQSDLQLFVTDSEADLARWTALLADGSIDQDEFGLLVNSDKDLLELDALRQAGLAEARMEALVNGVLETVVTVALKTFV